MAKTPRTPRSNPPGNPPRPKRVDTRPTLTLKGPGFTPEFRALINRAATVAGLTQADLVVQIVTAGAQRILKGEADPAAGPPPAVMLPQDELLRALDELRQDVADLKRARAAEQPAQQPTERPSLLRRLFGR